MIRTATAEDAAAVLAIYEPIVRDTAISFETETSRQRRDGRAHYPTATNGSSSRPAVASWDTGTRFHSTTGPPTDGRSSIALCRGRCMAFRSRTEDPDGNARPPLSLRVRQWLRWDSLSKRGRRWSLRILRLQEGRSPGTRWIGSWACGTTSGGGNETSALRLFPLQRSRDESAPSESHLARCFCTRTRTQPWPCRRLRGGSSRRRDYPTGAAMPGSTQALHLASATVVRHPSSDTTSDGTRRARGGNPSWVTAEL